MSKLECRIRRAAPGWGKASLCAMPAGRFGLIAVGAGALLLGALVYWVDRTPGRSLLIPGVGALAGSPGFGAWGHWLPSFLHPLAFGLFTAALLPARSAWRVRGCVLWGAVNVVFELGQCVLVSGPLAVMLLGGAGTAAAPWRAALAAYFTAGTADVRDLVAAVLGAAAAVAVLHAAARRRETLDAS